MGAIIFGGTFLVMRQFSLREIILGGNYPWGNYPGDNHPVGNYPGGQFSSKVIVLEPIFTYFAFSSPSEFS